MAGVEDAPSENVALMCRIVQLEHERDELRHDVEQLSTQQAGTFGSVDIVARIQARRTAGLEQELESYKQKLTVCTKENYKLQEELSEVYVIKSKFSDLLKVEVEKSGELEKEVKFFQGRVAAALADRDRAIVEVEKYHRKEHGMMETMNELQDRLEQITSEYSEHKKLCMNLQTDLERTKAESEVYEKVVERFWNIREQAIGSSDAERIHDRAAILLEDSENSWSYGVMNKALEDLRAQAEQAKETLAMVQEEFQASVASVESLERQLEEENTFRRQAEDTVFRCKEQLSCLTELVDSELQQVHSAKQTLKEDIASFLEEEGKWVLSISETWQHILNKARTSHSVSESVVKLEEERLGVNNDATQHDPDATQHESQGIKECVEDVKASYSAELNEPEPVANGEGQAADKEIPLDNIREKIVEKNEKTLGRSLEMDSQMLLLVDNKEAVAQDLQEKLEPTANGVGLEDIREGPGDNMRENGVKKIEEVVNRSLEMDRQMLLADDSKEAFAQALQEKVAALLLLSQQEERHILEKNTTSARESQITDLKQQLSQVTSEKVNALMELAQLHEECKRLQEKEKKLNQVMQKHRSTISSDRSTPVIGDHGVTSEDEKNLAVFANDGSSKGSVRGYLRHLWLRGPELGSKSNNFGHSSTVIRSTSGKENETVGIARLRVENASLRESLSSIRHLCNSAHRLRLTIARVAAESSAENESSIPTAIEAVDGVISEAIHLKVALHSSLPVHDLGWNSISSPISDASEIIQDGSDGEANEDLDIVSFLGLEIARLVLLAAEQQKRFLGQKI